LKQQDDDADEQSLDDLVLMDDRLREMMDGEESEDEKEETEESEKKNEKKETRPIVEKAGVQKPQKRKKPKKCMIS
jgi:hypothetical protein